MSFSLKPVKPMKNPAGSIVGTPDLLNVLEGFVHSDNTNMVVDATASADTPTTTHVAPTIPLETTHTTAAAPAPAPTPEPLSTRFQNFTLSDSERAQTSSNGFIPLKLDISDIENDASIPDEIKAKMIEERKKRLELENFILEKSHNEKLKYTQQTEKTSQIWLDKITPQQADQSQIKLNTQGLRKLLASALLNLNAEEDLKEVTHAIEATASVLTDLSTRSTHLEKIYQEKENFKNENANLKKELESLKQSKLQQEQQIKNHTSLISPVKTISQQQQPQQNTDLQNQLKQLNSYGKAVYAGFLQQNYANKDPVRDLKLALEAQQLAEQYSSVPQDVTYSQLYGANVMENLKKRKVGQQ